MRQLKSHQPRFIKYRVVGQDTSFKLAFFDGEVWVTQKQMADIFSLKLATINSHLKRIWRENKYPEAEYSHLFTITANDGKQYQVWHYRLEILEEIERKRLYQS